MHRFVSFYLFLAVALMSFAGCDRGDGIAAQPVATERLSDVNMPSPSCAVALAPYDGKDRIDSEINRLQQEAQNSPSSDQAFQRLGWMFVAKAHLSNDPGYYKLAEQCALCLEHKYSRRSPETLLLRGHVLHNLHRFSEAEDLARELIAVRETSSDYGLLGDVLMEQGRLNEAVEAYQKMINLKPNLQSYSRVAHIRWLKGDLQGSLKAMQMAARAGSSNGARDLGSTAWTYSRLALYQLQAGDTKKALEAADAALALQSDYAPAFLARGRILLAEGKASESVEPLQRAATLNPLPEYHWTLAEALHAAERADEARRVEAQLIEKGAASDPRTFALYLATRGEQIETSLRLAEKELTERNDVFTFDALAWALAAAGKAEEARLPMKRALAEGTKDARLFYHAGVIAARVGQKAEARLWLKKAAAIQQMLLPTEKEQLFKQLTAR